MGTIASLHLHAAVSGEPLETVGRIELVVDKGIRGDRRHFGRRSRSTGEPTRRQVTLIEREMLRRHAAALGLAGIAPGAARSNIETEGIDLAALVGRRVRVGTALLEIVGHRDPCAKMDTVAPGLRELMMPPCQGVLARVVETGEARVGDAVEVLGVD